MSTITETEKSASALQLPTAGELFSDFALDLSARRAAAGRLVSFVVESKSRLRASLYEDRQDEAGEKSLLLAGSKPAKADLSRETWSFSLCGAESRVEGVAGGWRATLRLDVTGKLDEPFRNKLEHLANECREESERLEASGAIRISSPREEIVQMGMVVGGAATAEVIRSISRYAREALPVLITGEDGTGKERIAQALHKESGRAGKLITLNCGCIPETLIADDLFGHERNAFTGASNVKKGAFEEADGGTLFLDEISEMPLEQQVALLRTLQEGTIRRLGSSQEKAVSVRVIAATNRNLDKMVEEGKFRKDLYYRLCVLRIAVKPLRERKDEIATIARHHVAKMAAEHDVRLDITDEAVMALEALNWPGNVRELVSRLEGGRIHAVDGRITPAALDLMMPEASTSSVVSSKRLPHEAFAENESLFRLAMSSEIIQAGNTHEKIMSLFESRVLLQVLNSTNFNTSAAARELGLSRSTMIRRMRELGIDKVKEEFRESTNAALPFRTRTPNLNMADSSAAHGANAAAA